MAVREFWLENANGVKYSLHTEKAFFHAPQGLGFSVDITPVRVGNSNFIISEEYNLGSISGEILFMENRTRAYQEYFNFVHFLYQKPITLHYLPPNDKKSYWCQVRVVLVDKTEMGEDSILRVPIEFYRQTMWFNDDVNMIEATNNAEDGKFYPLSRPYHYGLISIRNIDLYNDGVSDSPLFIEIDGECEDPSYNIYDGNGVMYGATKILGIYDYVAVDSSDLTENIVLMREGSSIPNAVNYQDLTVGSPRSVYVTFLKLRPGESKLVFNLGEDFGGKVRVRWNNAYVTV